MKDSSIHKIITGLVWTCDARSNGGYIEELRTSMKGKLDMCAIDLWRSEVPLSFNKYYYIKLYNNKILN